MNQEELLKEYTIIENRISEVVDFFATHKEEKPYKQFYKGISTLQSPLIYKPDILFVGINNGDGEYKEAMNNNKPIPVNACLDGNEPPKEINWFKGGNARGRFRKPKEWVSHNWYQRDKKVNNQFPKNMIDLLFEIAKLKYPEANHNYDNISVPFWHDEFGENIMYTNLYPVSTTDTKGLKKVHQALAKEATLKDLWKTSQGDEKAINEWVVRKYFISSINHLVKLIEPKVIVCMGMAALNDFTYTVHKGKEIVRTERTFDEKKIPVVGFSRKGSWNSRIPKIAKVIAPFLVPNQVSSTI
ncbi:hypothetical protein [Carboxylicivirga sp. RSCT41]|uniref:hypothetical protein n=1 Tax=Carboxylicivirga agarovorans TaxID=3417570 RepID=UPI003D34569F